MLIWDYPSDTFFFSVVI